MLQSHTLAVELSEKRERINVLRFKTEELSTEEKEERGKLEKRLIEIEPEIRAAIVAENAEGIKNTTGEDVEMRSLVSRSDLGNIFQAVIEHRATSGAEKELQDHFKLNGNQIPLSMLRMESRATGVTPAPATGEVGINQAEIIPAVFPASVAAFLNIDMPTVGTGEAVFPVLSTSADAGTPAENASQNETAGAFTSNVLSPKRIQAAFFYSREDAARFAGMDASLRMNLGDALSDKLDQQVLGGTEGLFTGTKLDNHNQSTVNDFEDYLSSFGWARVDGKYASTTGELKIVCGSATYAHAGETYAGTATNKGDLSALEKLMDITAGVKVSAHVPAVASNKQNAVIRLGARRDMVAAIWAGITLIPDEITLAKKGQIQITAVMLHAIKILRSDGFYKQQSQHA